MSIRREGVKNGYTGQWKKCTEEYCVAPNYEDENGGDDNEETRVQFEAGRSEYFMRSIRPV